MKFVKLSYGEGLVIVSESGNEYLVSEIGTVDYKRLSVEKQPVEIWKRKRPRWPKKTILLSEQGDKR